MDFKSGAELLEQCAVRGMTISEVMKQRECDLTGVSMEDIEARMKDVLAVMRDSATLPLREPVTSIGGLIGGESARMEERRRKGTSILSGVLGRAVIYAMAVLEVNTSMGLIVAAPTAGSSGIVPGLLLALQEEYGLEDDMVADGLFAASAVGYLAMRNATVSGAVGGCQAEVGSASGMAAAALVHVMGGTPSQMAHACAMALSNTLGLVCDPVAGLVEVPCVNRNVMGAVNALSCAEMALSGVESAIPCDEVIDAMRAVGDALPASLRETGSGGLAATPTGRRLAERL